MCRFLHRCFLELLVVTMILAASLPWASLFPEWRQHCFSNDAVIVKKNVIWTEVNLCVTVTVSRLSHLFGERKYTSTGMLGRLLRLIKRISHLLSRCRQNHRCSNFTLLLGGMTALNWSNSACRTLIFPHSANQIANLWRGRCPLRCRC